MARRTKATRIVEGVCSMMQTREFSRNTVDAYRRWIGDFWRFHHEPYWRDVSGRHAEAFLDHLTHDRHLAPRTRNQAATSLAFLYREVLDSDAMDGVQRARGPKTVPLVMSHGECMRVLDELSGKYFVAGASMYGTGIRVSEVVALRVKDVDFELEQIVVRNGKGAKDRVVSLPQSLRAHLRRLCDEADRLRLSDRRVGAGWAPLPGALHRKDPEAGFTLGWQFLFPSSRITTDPASGMKGRWHLDKSAVQRKVKEAVRASGITKNASCHTFRHSYATESLRAGVDIRTLQLLMGHKDIRTTMIYLQAIEHVGVGVPSPLDKPRVDSPRSWSDRD